MATTKFIPETVFEAQRLVYGPVADAEALLELSRSSDDDAALSTLAMSTLERFVQAFHNYEHQLVLHGRPPAAACFESSAVCEDPPQ